MKYKVLLFFLIFLSIADSVQTNDFPGDLPGTDIGYNLPTGYEPSGAVWHTRLDKLFLVNDDGTVSKMDSDGTNVINWNFNGDLEGICIADPTTDYIYIGIENPDKIKEFDINSAVITRTFDLTPWMYGPSNLGLEALTFVKDTTSSEGGYFYAGLQYNGKIYVFELPIKTSSTSTDVNYITTITPVYGRSDISGLHYEEENQILYSIWDSYNILTAMKADGTILVEWDLPGNDQEGIALWEGDSLGQAKIFLAEDQGKEVMKYDFNSELTITTVGSGAVNCTPEQIIYYGSWVNLVAIPDTTNYFVEWNGDLTGNNNPDTLFLDYDKSVTATFAPLDPPDNVSINIENDSVCIYWHAVNGASSYNIYSSDSTTTGFELLINIADTIWTTELIGTQRFYYIKSSTEIYE